MTPAEAVADRIVAINTDASDRVYMLKLPQGLDRWPAVRVQATPRPREQHLRGPQYPVMSRVQVDHYAPERPGVDAMAQVLDLAAQVRGDGLGPVASGVFGWKGDSGGSPAITIHNVELISEGDPFYEADELRLVRIKDEYLVHWTHMN